MHCFYFKSVEMEMKLTHKVGYFLWKILMANLLL